VGGWGGGLFVGVGGPEVVAGRVRQISVTGESFTGGGKEGCLGFSRRLPSLGKGNGWVPGGQ